MKLTARTLIMMAAATGLCLMNTARAGLIPYGSVGTQNPATYTFTANATGDIIGYFAGSTAGYDEYVGMGVNGGGVLAYGLENHATAVGTSFDFGAVNAGDTIRFYLYVLNTNDVFSSDTLQNVDHVNHVYSTTATPGQAFAGSPGGIYVAFEDLYGGGDLNYHDNTFVFTNVSNGVDSVPDGGTSAALLGGAILAIAALRRRFARA